MDGIELLFLHHFINDTRGIHSVSFFLISVFSSFDLLVPRSELS